MLGRTPDLKRLADEEWHAAGAAGFEIFAGGEASVADFLEGLRKSYPYSGAATEGAQAIFGRIYQVLEFGREDCFFPVSFPWQGTGSDDAEGSQNRWRCY